MQNSTLKKSLLVAVLEGQARPTPPLGVDFETALGALLKTPPPAKAETMKPNRTRKPRKRERVKK